MTLVYYYKKLVYLHGKPNRHQWIAHGASGAVEFWASPVEMDGRIEWYGGVEVHSKTKSDYAGEIPRCSVIGGQCWTSGSSMAFDDEIEPYLRMEDENEWDGLLSFFQRSLERWYITNFKDGEQQ
jgi:hypothetical protein